MLLGKMLTLMSSMLVTKAKQSSDHFILVIEEAKLGPKIQDALERKKKDQSVLWHHPVIFYPCLGWKKNTRSTSINASYRCK